MPTDKIILSWAAVQLRADKVAHGIRKDFPGQSLSIWGVPKGGVFAALAAQSSFTLLDGRTFSLSLVEDPALADLYVDDIIDSGRTRERVIREHGEKPFYALVDKTNGDPPNWFDFPWERACDTGDVKENVVRLMEFIGEDPTREGLRETPDRVVRSYSELFSGYGRKPEDVLKTFDGEGYDEVILVKDISLTSFCEHHWLPFEGVAHVAYIPNGRIVGLSKIARLVDVFARRLQVQERLTIQVASALMEHLKPLGAACVIDARHSCLTCRGARQPDARMRTSCLLGAFRDKPEARAELFSLIEG